MDYTEIKVRQNVSKALPNILHLIGESGDIMIKPPKGAGKTYAMLKLREQIPGKKIKLLYLTRTLADNICKDNYGVPCGYGTEWLNASQRSSFIVTTYGSIQIMADWDRPPAIL